MSEGVNSRNDRSGKGKAFGESNQGGWWHRTTRHHLTLLKAILEKLAVTKPELTRPLQRIGQV